MKKWCALLLMLVLIGTLGGCGEEKPTTAEPSVTIHIPREMIDAENDEDIVLQAEEEGMEASVDEDIITYKMTPEKQQELLLFYKNAFEERLPDVLAEGAIPGVVDVTYNDDMTEFTVVADSEIFDINMNGMGLGMLYTTGMGYQLYAGVPEDKIDVRVVIVDKKDKHQLGEYCMSEVFAAQQAPSDNAD